MAIPAFVLGADPEVFVLRGEEPVPGWEITEGTKDMPEYWFTADGSHFFYQWDNAMLEVNVPPRLCTSGKDILDTLIWWATQIEENIMNMDDNLDIYMKCYNKFKVKDFDERWFVFGCAPDMDARTGKTNPPPLPSQFIAKNGDFIRFAGGHLHFGDTDKLFANRGIKFVRKFICTLHEKYMREISLDKWERERIKRYGGGPFYRYKRGKTLEYRSPSNKWLYSDERCEKLAKVIEATFEELF